MRQKCPQSLLIAFAVLSLLFLGQTKVEAQDSPNPKANPAVQLLLLSEEEPLQSPNIVFVTSIAYDGNLGGLVGADQKCQARAEAAGLPKNTYKAWLSTPSVNAIDRLGGARGWVRVDGKPFADTKADIVAGKIFYPPRVDELGNYDDTPYGSPVWTGTGSDGTLIWSGDTCSEWTSSSTTANGYIGDNDSVAGVFTSLGMSGCNATRRLYCFGINNATSVAVKPVTGRIAFVTKDALILSGGLASADQKCMDEAQAAGLSGTFKALLATNSASAASRFSVSGQPWVRRDGVAIAPTAADLFSAKFLDSAINLSADGLQYFGYDVVWNGAWIPIEAGTSDTTCNNWTSSSPDDTAANGISCFTYQGKFFANYYGRCNTPYHLYCLQE